MENKEEGHYHLKEVAVDLDQLSKRSQNKINQILNSAEHLFLQHSLKEVTIEQIVQEAQVSKATFYKYFPNKVALIEHLLASMINENIAELHKLIEKGKKHRLTIDDFLTMFDIEAIDQRYSYQFIQDLMQEYPALLREMTLKYQGAIIPLYKEIIRLAKVDGIVRMDIDDDILITYTMIFKKGAREQLPVPPHMDLKEFHQKVLELYLYGIMSQDYRK